MCRERCEFCDNVVVIVRRALFVYVLGRTTVCIIVKHMYLCVFLSTYICSNNCRTRVSQNTYPACAH